jgi:hypothetical protein
MQRLRRENPSKFRKIEEKEGTARITTNVNTGKSWQFIGDKSVPVYNSAAERGAEEQRSKLHEPSRRFTIELPSTRTKGL